MQRGSRRLNTQQQQRCLLLRIPSFVIFRHAIALPAAGGRWRCSTVQLAFLCCATMVLLDPILVDRSQAQPSQGPQLCSKPLAAPSGSPSDVNRKSLPAQDAISSWATLTHGGSAGRHGNMSPNGL